MPWPNLQGIYMAMPKRSRKRKRPQFGVLMSMMPKRNRSGAAICGGEPAFWPDFLVAYLAMSPVTATQIGFHNYESVNLDSILDDYTPNGLRGLRIFYNSMH